MTQANPMAAQLLNVSSAAYGAYATNRLFERCPEAKDRFGEMAFTYWKDHFGQRIKELSAAVLVGEVGLFNSHVSWAKAAFEAREIQNDLIRESLDALKDVLGEELPEMCRQTPIQFIETAIQDLKLSNKSFQPLEATDPPSKLALQYLVKVLNGDGNSAIELIIDAFENGLDVNQTYHALLLAQQEVGRMWHLAEVSIAEEHLVTLTTERAMAVLVYKSEKKPSNGKTVVSAAVAENSHHIGVRAVSDIFEINGWRGVCLGSDSPASEIAHAAEVFKASLVLLSAAISTHLNSLQKAIEIIRKQSPNCKILVGGMAFAGTNDLWKQLGADGFAANPVEALSVAAKLVGVTK